MSSEEKIKQCQTNKKRQMKKAVTRYCMQEYSGLKQRNREPSHFHDLRYTDATVVLEIYGILPSGETISLLLAGRISPYRLYI